MEPYKLRRWKKKDDTIAIDFWTCARPGRSKGPHGSVSDEIVVKWISHLPPGVDTIISLLGTKPNGMSEFSFYSFGSDRDDNSRTTFQEFIERIPGFEDVTVLEFPTTDFQRIPPEQLTSIKAATDARLHSGSIIVLVDSGGEQRTRQVCNHLGLVENCCREGGATAD